MLPLYIILGVVAGIAVIAMIIVLIKKAKVKAFLSDVKKRQDSAAVKTNVELEGMDFAKLVGTTGIAVSDLRPYGKMRVGTEVFEVLAMDDAYIATQKKLIVVKIGANDTIYVKEK